MSRPASAGLGAAFDARAALETVSARARRRGKKPNTQESFWENADRSGGPDACWPWKLRRQADTGHGHVSWAGVDAQAHRVAWSLVNGPIPPRRVVRHDYDNPPYVNPAHLLLGTVADNNRDMHERGRARVDQLVHLGATNCNAKLTDAFVVELRAAWAGGESIKAIARRTGLAVGTIHPMVHGRTWKHVPLATRAALVGHVADASQVRRDWDAIEDAVAAMGEEPDATSLPSDSPPSVNDRVSQVVGALVLGGGK